MTDNTKHFPEFNPSKHTIPADSMVVTEDGCIPLPDAVRAFKQRPLMERELAALREENANLKRQLLTKEQDWQMCFDMMTRDRDAHKIAAQIGKSKAERYEAALDEIDRYCDEVELLNVRFDKIRAIARAARRDGE